MRCSLVIDGNNVFHSAKEHGITIDYVALRNILIEGELVSAVFVTGTDSKADTNQNKFLTWMKHNGFRVRTKEIEHDDSGSRQINVEPIIITELCLAAQNCDCIVFVGGNRDHHYPLARIVESGKRVVVAGFSNSVSNLLKETADEFVDLTRSIDNITKKD